MAGTDITNLLEIIQRKIDAADSTSATQDLLYLLSAVRQGDGSSLELYDSTGAFPDLTDSAADTEMIGYKLDSDRLYFNVGVWKGKTLPPPPPVPYSFQGSNFGYTSGGGPAASNVIDKFSFTSDGNASDVGDLTVARYQPSGQSSSASGYSSGGYGPVASNVIDKFSFPSDGNATDVGDLATARQYLTGQSSSENGYASGGGTPTYSNIIEKFPFATDANATDVGDLTATKGGPSGQSSTVSGYTSGGTVSPYSDIIDKFPFATDANASDVGNLTVARDYLAGQSSSENGYSSGGRNPAAGSPGSTLNIIDKFPFASDANASDVGDLTRATDGPIGQSSTVSGYTSAGSILGGARTNTIDKFPFASDANATDVGDLTEVKEYAAGQQN
jgi:hypothetical protein